MLTPSHLALGIFLGSLTFPFLNAWAVMLGSMVMDIEPLLLIIFRQCYYCPHHGFFHSIFGALVGSFILSLLIWLFRRKLDEISLKLKIKQFFSFPRIFFSSFFAWSLHVFMDSLTHYDVFPFWPNVELYFRQDYLYWPLSIFSLFSGLLGIFIFYLRTNKWRISK